MRGSRVLGRRGCAVEGAFGQVCREAGARVATYVQARDSDVTEQRGQGRRLEVVAEGLFVFGGSQLAFDATLVVVLQRDGIIRTKADIVHGVALQVGRRRGALTFPEFHGNNGRTRFVVIAWEVAGRWSREFMRSLACEKPREASKILARERPGWLVQEVGLFLGVRPPKPSPSLW